MRSRGHGSLPFIHQRSIRAVTDCLVVIVNSILSSLVALSRDAIYITGDVALPRRSHHLNRAKIEVFAASGPTLAMHIQNGQLPAVEFPVSADFAGKRTKSLTSRGAKKQLMRMEQP